MIYLVGGAPRTGKTLLSQQAAARLRTSWISTDLLKEVLKIKTALVPHVEWNVEETIATTAEWFFPYLERFVWGASSLSDHYIIEGVDFLPAQAARLAVNFELRAVFLGRSRMSLEVLDRFPGRSQGYASLPIAVKHQIVQHVPMHSVIIRQEAEIYQFPYIDMTNDFTANLDQAQNILIRESA